MKVKKLVALSTNVDQFYIGNVFELEDYSYEKHSELEVSSYELRIDRVVSYNTINETITMIINPKVDKKS